MRVTCPDQQSCAWFKHAFNASELSPAKDFLVWHMVLPADAENFAKAVQVELVQFLDMPPAAGPGLAAIQEGRQHNRSVYIQRS